MIIVNVLFNFTDGRKCGLNFFEKTYMFGEGDKMLGIVYILKACSFKIEIVAHNCRNL